MNVKLIATTKGVGEFEGRSGEEVIIYAARVSSPRNDKFDKPEGLIKYCIKNKHWSILETVSMTIEVTTSVAIGRQMLRHWSLRFQEFSQRYSPVCNIEPVELRREAKVNRQSSGEVFNPSISLGSDTVHANDLVENVLASCKTAYEALLKAGVAKECARMVLPMATSTTFYMTGSLRSWVHFLGVRDEEHSQKEIQLIAKDIKGVFIEQYPIISKALDYV